jgi:diguanylate cyclase
VHAPAFVAASLAVAIGASGLALWLAAGSGGRPPMLLSATAFGIAISGMHYTAMAGLTLYPHAPASSAPALSSDLLAIVVAIVAFLVSVVFLLFLVPDRSTEAEPAALARASPNGEADQNADIGQGTYGPLGGAGAPPRRLARHLPIERDGVTHFVPIDQVVAVHANAHYTYVFDGTAKLFCPLAIGDVEARLDANRFVRVHRSHIVNIERVAGLRRAGDGGLVEMAATDRYAVPVSRSRVGSLKSRISARLAEAAE